MFNVVTGSSVNAIEAVAARALEHIRLCVFELQYLKKDCNPATVKDTRTPAEWMEGYIKSCVSSYDSRIQHRQSQKVTRRLCGLYRRQHFPGRAVMVRKCVK
jgi:hypothetical protein